MGDINKRNILGYLPHEVNHNQPMANIPEDLKHNFLEVLQETDEADYMIITSETKENKGKTKIIVSQLEDLNMIHGEDYSVYKLDPEDEETGLRKVLISIKFT